MKGEGGQPSETRPHLHSGLSQGFRAPWIRAARREPITDCRCRAHLGPETPFLRRLASASWKSLSLFACLCFQPQSPPRGFTSCSPVSWRTWQSSCLLRWLFTGPSPRKPRGGLLCGHPSGALAEVPMPRGWRSGRKPWGGAGPPTALPVGGEGGSGLVGWASLVLRCNSQ